VDWNNGTRNKYGVMNLGIPLNIKKLIIVTEEIPAS